MEETLKEIKKWFMVRIVVIVAVIIIGIAVSQLFSERIMFWLS